MTHHIDQLHPGMSASIAKPVTSLAISTVPFEAALSRSSNASASRFALPVRPGDTVRATVTVKEVNVAKNRVTLDTICTVGGKVVIEGECQMMPPVRAAAVTGTA